MRVEPNLAAKSGKDPVLVWLARRHIDVYNYQNLQRIKPLAALQESCLDYSPYRILTPKVCIIWDGSYKGCIIEARGYNDMLTREQAVKHVQEVIAKIPGPSCITTRLQLPTRFLLISQSKNKYRSHRVVEIRGNDVAKPIDGNDKPQLDSWPWFVS